MNRYIPLIIWCNFQVQFIMILIFFPAPLSIEIKPRKKLKEDWNTLRPKFRVAYALASEKAWKFKII